MSSHEEGAGIFSYCNATELHVIKNGHVVMTRVVQGPTDPVTNEAPNVVEVKCIDCEWWDHLI